MDADEELIILSTAKAKQSALPPPLQGPSCAKSAPSAPPARDVSGQVFGLLGRLFDSQQARSEQRIEMLRQLTAEQQSASQLSEFLQRLASPPERPQLANADGGSSAGPSAGAPAAGPSHAQAALPTAAPKALPAPGPQDAPRDMMAVAKTFLEKDKRRERRRLKRRQETQDKNDRLKQARLGEIAEGDRHSECEDDYSDSPSIRGKSIPVRRRSRCPTPRRGKSIPPLASLPPHSSRDAEKPGQRPVTPPRQPKTAGAIKGAAARASKTKATKTKDHRSEKKDHRAAEKEKRADHRNEKGWADNRTEKEQWAAYNQGDNYEPDKEDHAAGEKDHGDKKDHAADKRDHKDHGDKRGRERDERNERDEVVEDEFEADFSSLDEPGGAPRPSPMGRTRLRGRQVLQPISI